jgi:adenylyltransferase/sulfurtransferase
MADIDKSKDRYARHLVLKEIGPAGQEKLEKASVLIIGAGALGSVQAHLLARAGVGKIRIVDRDLPEASNLQRQFLYDELDVAFGQPKAEIAAKRLKKINSQIEIEGIHIDVSQENVEQLIKDVDLVLDACDNFKTRYVVNSACQKQNIPWVYGGILGTTGMSLPIIFDQGPCLTCLFPEHSGEDLAANPATVGILNTAPTTIASLQATQAYKFFISGSMDVNRFSIVDLWSSSLRNVEVFRDEHCPCCRKKD